MLNYNLYAQSILKAIEKLPELKNTMLKIKEDLK
mgnify:CR=1 FL=1